MADFSSSEVPPGEPADVPFNDMGAIKAIRKAKETHKAMTRPRAYKLDKVGDWSPNFDVLNQDFVDNAAPAFDAVMPGIDLRGGRSPDWEDGRLGPRHRVREVFEGGPSALGDRPDMEQVRRDVLDSQGNPVRTVERDMPEINETTGLPDQSRKSAGGAAFRLALEDFNARVMNNWSDYPGMDNYVFEAAASAQKALDEMYTTRTGGKMQLSVAQVSDFHKLFARYLGLSGSHKWDYLQWAKGINDHGIEKARAHFLDYTDQNARVRINYPERERRGAYEYESEAPLPDDYPEQPTNRPAPPPRRVDPLPKPQRNYRSDRVRDRVPQRLIDEEYERNRARDRSLGRR